jgi:Cof subfamily protein (haloacid dehalogenase superfamily)
VVEKLVDVFDADGSACAVKLLCLDLDGTLLASNKRVSAGNRRSIERAREAGLHVALASGRHPFNVRDQLDDLGLPHDAVCLSGAYVMANDHEVFRHELPGDAVERVIDVVARLGCYVSLAGSDFNLVCGAVDRGSDGKSGAVLRYTECSDYGDLRKRAVTRADKILKGAVHADDEGAYRALREGLRAVPGVEVVQSDKFWLDVVACGCSKAEGIEALARSFGLGMSEVAAVGDDENDAEALAAVGLGIVVANAVPSARAAAKISVADNDNDGVAEAIAFLVERRTC